MPKNILQYKAKTVGPFTTRQILFGGVGIAVIFLFAIYIFADAPEAVRKYGSALLGVPFMAFGFVNIYGLPLEKILPLIIRENILLPQNRYYKTEYTEILLNQDQLEEEPTDKKTKKKKKKQKKITQKMIQKSKDPQFQGMI